MSRRLATYLGYSPPIAAVDLLILHTCSFIALGAVAPAARGENLRVYAHLAPLLSIVALVCWSVCGLYRSWSRRPAVNLASSLLTAECLYVTAWMSLSGWEPRWAISRSAIAASAIAQLVALTAGRISIRELIRRRGKRETGVIVAENPHGAAMLRQKLSGATGAWLTVSESIAPEQFLSLAGEQMAWDTVVVGEEVKDKIEILRRAAGLHMSVLVLPGWFELSMIGARPVEVDDLLMLRLAPQHLRPAQRAIKRLGDVAGSLCLLALTSPLTIAAAILVRLSSPGPVLFRQTRVGANGTEYSLLKLRTMIDDAERQTGPVLASLRDPRITPVGRLLRALRIDELPQLVNVLMGEMSLIGPRPERPHFVRTLCERLPGYNLRLGVKPGITGLAQVYGGYSTSPELKLRFDLMYIYNYSLLLDLQILFKTILTVLQTSHAAGFRDTVNAATLADRLEPQNWNGEIETVNAEAAPEIW